MEKKNGNYCIGTTEKRAEAAAQPLAGSVHSAIAASAGCSGFPDKPGFA